MPWPPAVTSPSSPPNPDPDPNKRVTPRLSPALHPRRPREGRQGPVNSARPRATTHQRPSRCSWPARTSCALTDAGHRVVSWRAGLLGGVRQHVGELSPRRDVELAEGTSEVSLDCF